MVTRKNASLVGETLDLLASLGARSTSFSRFSSSGYLSTHAAALLPSRTNILIALEAADTRAELPRLSVQSTMPIPPCVVEHEDYPLVRFGSCPIGTSTCMSECSAASLALTGVRRLDPFVAQHIDPACSLPGLEVSAVWRSRSSLR